MVVAYIMCKGETHTHDCTRGHLPRCVQYLIYRGEKKFGQCIYFDGAKTIFFQRNF